MLATIWKNYLEYETPQIFLATIIVFLVVMLVFLKLGVEMTLADLFFTAIACWCCRVITLYDVTSGFLWALLIFMRP